jgi:hypothetical protein
MKSETSVSVVCPDVLPAIRHYAVAALVAVALIAPSAMAENAVRFHGSVVNATCNIQPVSQPVSSDGVRHLELPPGVAFEVQATRNACDGQAAPFIAHYTPVQASAAEPSSAGQTSESARAGVVTLTYQ